MALNVLAVAVVWKCAPMLCLPCRNPRHYFMTGMPAWSVVPVPKTVQSIALQWRPVWDVLRQFSIAGEPARPNAAVMNLAAVDEISRGNQSKVKDYE